MTLQMMWVLLDGTTSSFWPCPWRMGSARRDRDAPCDGAIGLAEPRANTNVGVERGGSPRMGKLRKLPARRRGSPVYM